LCAFFIANTIVAEFIGIKIFSFEKLLSLSPADISLFGVQGLGFNLTAGAILWPVVFIMTDIINEYYGKRAVRFLSWTAVVIVLYAFLMVYASIGLPANDWWRTESGKLLNEPILDMQVAFSGVMGQGIRIILGSMVAFLVGQILDVYFFHRIKKFTGENKVWLRATGSTLISQWIDSYVVLIIAFGGTWEWPRLIAIGSVNYLYKFGMAILLTPLIYLGHYAIDRYLGNEKASAMKHEAAKN
jgi:hypothetical protein